MLFLMPIMRSKYTRQPIAIEYLSQKQASQLIIIKMTDFQAALSATILSFSR